MSETSETCDRATLADLSNVTFSQALAAGRTHCGWLAGWPDDRPVWTGSCPCQPFSVAGKGGGVDDPRHLWPAFRWLIAQCRPETIFGEQVRSSLGIEWLAGVYDDLEALGYRVPKDKDGKHECYSLPACGVGAPHIRQRLFWEADNGCERGRTAHTEQAKRQSARIETGRTICGVDWSRSVWWPCRDGKWRRVPARRVENANRSGFQAERIWRTGPSPETGASGPDGGLPDTELRRPEQCEAGKRAVSELDPDGLDNGGLRDPQDDNGRRRERDTQSGAGPDGLGRRGLASRSGDVPPSRHDRLEAERPVFGVAYGLSASVDEVRLVCDEEAFPLAAKHDGRVGLLKGYGNAIIPELAAQFIRAYLEISNDTGL